MYKAHICVVIEPETIVDVDCDMLDVSEDGSVQLYRGRALVGHFPSVEYAYLTGDPDPYFEAALDEELKELYKNQGVDEEDEDDEEYEEDDEEDEEEADDLADASHVTDPGGDTSALNGKSPDSAVVGSVEED